MVMKMVGNALIASAIAVTATGSVPIFVTSPPPVQTYVENLKEEQTWKCPECTPEEKYVLEQLQEHTKIKDRNALATILGNIQQESRFVADICEGGARVSYTECKSRGNGLIQWTSIGRYKALGNFCAKFS